jgi:hypothetical protein
MANSFFREFLPSERPTTIRIRPILPADQLPDEAGMFDTIAGLLFSGAAQIARNLASNQVVTRNRLLENATGYLQMTNIDNDAHAHVEDLRLEDLDVFALLDLFDSVRSGSNPDLTIYTVQWQYWVNPQSVQFGGARLAQQRDGTCKHSNTVYEFNGVRAGCGAVCAAVFLIKHLPEHFALNNQLNRPSSKRKIFDIAMQLQDTLGNL